ADVIAYGERVPARRAAEDQGLALEGREAEEELDQRRLAGAVRAEEADALAVDGAAEAPQRLDRAVALPHVAQLDHLAQRNLRLGELSTGISGFLSMARSAPGGDDRPGMRVLLIEDSEADAALILRALRRSGAEVHHERVGDADAMRAAL